MCKEQAQKILKHYSRIHLETQRRTVKTEEALRSLQPGLCSGISRLRVKHVAEGLTCFMYCL